MVFWICFLRHLTQCKRNKLNTTVLYWDKILNIQALGIPCFGRGQTESQFKLMAIFCTPLCFDLSCVVFGCFSLALVCILSFVAVSQCCYISTCLALFPIFLLWVWHIWLRCCQWFMYTSSLLLYSVHKWTLQLGNTWHQPSLRFVNETSPILELPWIPYSVKSLLWNSIFSKWRLSRAMTSN